MKKSDKRMSEPTKAGTSPASRGNGSRPTRIAELLSTAVTVGAVVLLTAMSGPKLPKWSGD